MDSTQYLKLLENPFNIDLEVYQDLKKLSDEHPFCQSIIFLNARYLLEQNHSGFEDSSRQALAMAIDRKLFKDYISGKANPLKTKNLTDYKSVYREGCSNNDPRKNHIHLIEKFIKEEPRISPPQNRLSSENLADKKSSFQKEIVTETLAQVYLQQGFEGEAIDIYKKLSLKNPEKSSYFAKKIESINNQQKS